MYKYNIYIYIIIIISLLLNINKNINIKNNKLVIVKNRYKIFNSFIIWFIFTLINLKYI